jgi:glycosyltransferase involved in cell wall biosynthesis
MKVAMVINNLAVSGGYQKLALRLAEQLERGGNRVTFYTFAVDRNQCYPDLLERFDVVVPKVGMSFLRSGLTAGLRRARLARALAEQITPDVDAIVLHDELVLPILRYVSRPSVRVVWMLNNELSAAFTTPAKAMARRISGADGSASRHIGLRLASLPLLVWSRRRTSLAVRRVDTVATYDELNAKRVREVLRRPAVVVYAGADIDRHAADSFRVGSSRRTQHHILSVGVIYPHRRYEDLIRAIALTRCPEPITLTIVGKQSFAPEYVRSLEELAAAEGVADRVILKDVVSEADLIRLHGESDLFAFVNDGGTWGIAVFEAIAMGLPVVITNNIGAADLIQPDRHGWVVPPRRPDHIAVAIEEILHNPSVAASVACRARREVLPFVSWRAFGQRFAPLLIHPDAAPTSEGLAL